VWSSERGADRRLGLLLLSLPVFAVAGAIVGYAAHRQAALMHPSVRMAIAVSVGTKQGQAFLTSGTSPERLAADAAAVIAAYGPATAALGAYVGIVFAGAAVATMLRRRRTVHAPHRGMCLSCGRCIAACPKEQERRREHREARGRLEPALEQAGSSDGPA
jgi:ferredoxin